MKRLTALLFLISMPLFSQSNSGELRLKVTDPSGRGVKTTVQIVSSGNQYRNALATNDQGDLDVQRLPYGIYQLQIERTGFAAKSQTVEVRSSLPTGLKIQLQLSPVNETVNVNASDTLIDPDDAGSVNQIGTEFIQSRLGSIPG
jgi:hypothetical protein